MSQKRIQSLQISERVENIPQALSIYINQLVYAMRRRGIQVNTLSLGEAYFDIPLMDFSKIDVTKGYHYSDSQGLPELREKLARFYEKQYQVPTNWEKEVLITAGSKPAIFMAMQAVLNPGDEILMPEPAWLSYPEQARLVGAVPRFVPYYKKAEEYVEYFTSKTKMIVINNPNNPSGKRYTPKELENLYTECRKRGIYILSDEAYSDFVLGNNFVSMAKIAPDKDGVIVVNSLSKNLGISGWRIGYVISSPEIIQNILKLNQHLITCAPTILLMYLAEYFDDLLKITLPQAQEATQKRAIVEEYMTEIGLPHLEGDATFYFLVNIGEYAHTSIELAMHLLFKHHIAVVPGIAYGESTARFIRVGIGVETIESIKRSIDIIFKVITENEYNAQLVADGLKELGMEAFKN